jgi:hypothetical protein
VGAGEGLLQQAGGGEEGALVHVAAHQLQPLRQIAGGRLAHRHRHSRQTWWLLLERGVRLV